MVSYFIIMEEKEIKQQIAEIEKRMQEPNFWQNKERAQEEIKKLNELKELQRSKNRYDAGDAVITIFSGAGGDDAEDWARILFEMYSKFAERKGYQIKVLHQHRSPDSGGYKNITFEVAGKGAYGLLKNESGVHRLVRVSPFSAKKLRHTSFALVEVIPRFIEPQEVAISPDDIKIEFMRASGPGGQNVNKRETAVRITHLPTNISVHVDSERSQQQNKERAMELLKARLYKLRLKQQKEEEESMKISKTTEAEWGRQIRSYVFHPYKLVKDHRTGVETSDVDAVLEGELDAFIEAEKEL